MEARLRFLGAAKSVTGSAYLLETADRRILVDCGMVQERPLQDRNWGPFPAKPSEIDAVLLTHSHLDHCGLLPKLVREGFSGPIYATAAACDIAGIVLLDSGYLQEEQAAHKKRRHQREGRRGPHPEIPLYTRDDAEACLPLFKPVSYEETLDLGGNVRAVFHDAGHILGSAMVKVSCGDGEAGRSIVFSGDIGRPDIPILRDPSTFEQADYLVMESTYGNRTHGKTADIPGQLADIVNDTHKRGGNLLIPSFAVERSQELLYHLGGLLEQDAIPHLMVFLDSPMAISVTEVFRRHPELFDEDSRALLERGEHPCDFPSLKLSRSVAESKAINHVKGTTIIIAGSGMCTGGRIKHHLEHNIAKPETTLLFVGYQAAGTLGRLLLEKKERVRIHGREHPVRARIERINGFSAHADREELLNWACSLHSPPRKVFITHGEEESAMDFARSLKRETGWQVAVPNYKDEAVLN